MGVHGLTTYLRENQRILGRTRQFSSAQEPSDDITTIVVDGWSLIYEVYAQSRLPWVYGGEYQAFARSVVKVVQAWIAVGLEVYFVFDGASPGLKIPTLISRLNRNNIHNSLLFFRTSLASRSTPRFLHENRIIPPLVFISCVEALQSLAEANSKFKVHFADEEGDPYAVELAGRLGAYVVGNDSDFVIFSSGRYAGYIPLGEMLWTTSVSDVSQSSSIHVEQEDGFQTVVGKTKKRLNASSQQVSYGLIPPEEVSLSDFVLSAVVYTPSSLASHLKLPTTLLPLLAALIGNDFSNQSTTQRNVQSLFFDRSLTLCQRITHTAKTLSSILNAAVQNRSAKHRVGSVMDLVDRTVNTLLVRSPSSLASGEVDSVVDRIVNAALQYAIDKYEGDTYGPASLWPTPMCALHGGDVCPLLNLFSRALLQNQFPGNSGDPSPDENDAMLRSLYLKAFRAGKLQPKVVDILDTGTFWPRIFLENPDIENVAVTIGRPIRSWIYALLDDVIGLPEAPEEEPSAMDDSVSDEGEEDPDELIDVIEEGSDDDADLLAPLRGELWRLRGTDARSAGAVPTSASSRSRSRPPAQPKYVTEYVRRGTRIAPEQVPVPDLAALMISSGFDENLDSNAWVPVQLRSLEERMALFLHVLGSNVPAVRNVSPDQLMSVLVVRWVVQTLHRRAVEEGMNREREKERWMEKDARAFLASYWLPHSVGIGDTASHGHTNGSDDASLASATPLTDRNVQLMAQVLAAIETINLLSQVLFLADHVPTHIEALSGQRFHAVLTKADTISVGDLPPGLWDACTASLEDAFTVERQKKKPKAERVQPVAYKANNEVTTRSRQGLFSLLLDEAV